MGANAKCCVRDCGSKRSRVKDTNLSFFSVPNLGKRLKKKTNDDLYRKRLKWLHAVDLLNHCDDSTPLFVCSKHFVGGHPSEDECNTDWVPNLELGEIAQEETVSNMDELDTGDSSYLCPSTGIIITSTSEASSSFIETSLSGYESISAPCCSPCPSCAALLDNVPTQQRASTRLSSVSDRQPITSSNDNEEIRALTEKLNEMREKTGDKRQRDY